MLLPLAGLAMLLAFGTSSCDPSDNPSDEISFRPTEVPANDTLYYELNSTNFLTASTRYNVTMPTSKMISVTFVFECAQSVSWRLENIPAYVKVDRTSGNGWGFFTATLSENTTGKQRSSKMKMILTQHDMDGKEIIGLTHEFCLIQP